MVLKATRRRRGPRLYDSQRWRKARLLHLARFPLCAICDASGKVTAATDVDHVVPHKGDPELFWDDANWQSLCHRHHSQKTRADNRAGGVEVLPRRGG